MKIALNHLAAVFLFSTCLAVLPALSRADDNGPSTRNVAATLNRYLAVHAQWDNAIREVSQTQGDVAPTIFLSLDRVPPEDEEIYLGFLEKAQRSKIWTCMDGKRIDVRGWAFQQVDPIGLGFFAAIENNMPSSEEVRNTLAASLKPQLSRVAPAAESPFFAGFTTMRIRQAAETARCKAALNQTPKPKKTGAWQ
jgi:hypothetical protein